MSQDTQRQEAGLHWENWSGSLRFQPHQLAEPENEGDVVALVHWARKHQRHLRAVGSSHSSTQILETDDTLVSLKHIKGVRDYKGVQATVGAGSVLKELGDQLLEIGLAPVNLGDVALQTIGGAIGTGTHGTGRTLGNLSTMLVGGRLVNGKGEIVTFSEQTPDILQAARVSLGMLGIFTDMRLKLLPAYKLRRTEYFTTVRPCMENLDALINENRNFDFYWYPRSDEIKLRVLNEPGQGMNDIPWAKCVEDHVGWAEDVLHKHTDMTNRFDEMEYLLPAEAGPDCFMEIRERMRAQWRRIVAWRLLYRTISADDAFISPAYGRPSVSISVHQNAGLPFQDFFADIEPIMRAYGGRPHWAKKHTMKAADLKALYPEWQRFLDIRGQMDPDGIFMSPYLRELFQP